ncbi:competence protein CoiA [Alkalibacillus aidingensis]|uniref:competence protein CoiA n=1 Tax=Alkalibacillus aidingensis TaxID=2747607 RepID=UPI0016615DC3|nr:competence protein CoiA family protein [Alkalibacillus aidingensis]
MIKAVNAEGKEFIASNQSQDRLEKLRNQMMYCPACQEKVVLRAGKINIPHFAHHPDSTCKFGTGETETHLLGKITLANWLKQQGYLVRLEHYLKSVQQRADLLLKFQNQYYAIEYQCSPLEPAQLAQRTRGFLSRQIIPVWLFGPSYYRPLTRSSLKVRPALRSCLTLSSYVPPPRLIFYEPNQQLFRIHEVNYHHLDRTFTNNSIVHSQKTTFNQIIYGSFLDNHTWYHDWLKAKRHFRTRQRQFIKDVDQHFFQYLYMKNLHPQYLPSCIYLPVKDYHLNQEPVYTWQSYIMLDLFKNKKVGDRIFWQEVTKLCEKMTKSNLPTAYPIDPLQPVMDYLTLLVKLGYLKQINDHTFIKAKEVRYPKTLEQALQFDEKLLHVMKKYRLR